MNRIHASTRTTITTSALPTAGYGVVGSIAVANPTPESFAAVPSKRCFLSDQTGYDRTTFDRSMVERALPMLHLLTLVVFEL